MFCFGRSCRDYHLPTQRTDGQPQIAIVHATATAGAVTAAEIRIGHATRASNDDFII